MTLLHSSLFCFVKATLDSTQDNCTETFSFCMLILLVSLTNFMYTYIYISKPFMIFQRSKLRINRSHMWLKFRICDLKMKSQSPIGDQKYLPGLFSQILHWVQIFQKLKMVDYLNNMACFSPISMYTKTRLHPVEVLYAKLLETNMFSKVYETLTYRR